MRSIGLRAFAWGSAFALGLTAGLGWAGAAFADSNPAAELGLPAGAAAAMNGIDAEHIRPM